jgi:S1-C subfamily serine protease
MRLIHLCSHALVPGLTRRLLLAVLATLALAVAASPAGAAGHTDARAAQRTGANVGIVDIYTSLGYQNGRAAGTGMIVSRSGEVLTNNHVIRGATGLRVVDVTTHRSYSATVLGYSVLRDVAVLQLAHASGLNTVKLGGYVHVRVGQRVVARGNAQGRGGAPKAARGRVVALHRKIFAKDESGDSERLIDVIAADTPVVPGYSGGPLQTTGNRVIGMVTAGSTVGFPRGFSIPIKRALSLAGKIRKGKSSSTIHIGPTAFLGVVLADVPGGAEVRDVVANLAADDAGLQAGDIITSLNGRTIVSSATVRRVLLPLVPGKAVSIAWTDKAGNPQTGTITPTSGPPQ